MPGVLVTSRSFEEYAAFFDLSEADLWRRVLDAGGGASGFTAVAARRGTDVVAVDPALADPVAVADAAARTAFLDDLATAPDRYVPGALPDLQDRVFPLVVQGSGEPVAFLPALLDRLRDDGFQATVRSVPYRFQRHGTEMLLAEKEGFAHLHFHVVPRSPDLPPEFTGPRIFGLLGSDAPVAIEEQDRLAERIGAALPDR